MIAAVGTLPTATEPCASGWSATGAGGGKASCALRQPTCSPPGTGRRAMPPRTRAAVDKRFVVLVGRVRKTRLIDDVDETESACQALVRDALVVPCLLYQRGRVVGHGRDGVRAFGRAQTEPGPGHQKRPGGRVLLLVQSGKSPSTAVADANVNSGCTLGLAAHLIVDHDCSQGSSKQWLCCCWRRDRMCVSRRAPPAPGRPALAITHSSAAMSVRGPSRRGIVELRNREGHLRDVRSIARRRPVAYGRCSAGSSSCRWCCPRSAPTSWGPTSSCNAVRRERPGPYQVHIAAWHATPARAAEPTGRASSRSTTSCSRSSRHPPSGSTAVAVAMACGRGSGSTCSTTWPHPARSWNHPLLPAVRPDRRLDRPAEGAEA